MPPSASSVSASHSGSRDPGSAFACRPRRPRRRGLLIRRRGGSRTILALVGPVARHSSGDRPDLQAQIPALTPPNFGTVMLFGGPYPVYRLLVMAISLATIVATFLFFFRTHSALPPGRSSPTATWHRAAASIPAPSTASRCLRRRARQSCRRGDGARFDRPECRPRLAGPTAALSILVGLGSISGPLVGGAVVGATDSLGCGLNAGLRS